MQQKKWHRTILFFTVLAGICAGSSLVSLTGCSVEKTGGTKVCDLEYELVEEEELPAELKTAIEEKKAADFKMTQEKDGYLYVVRGYGEQETGGYSIQILDFYLTDRAVVFDSGLLGPEQGSQKTSAPSYPYVVIRTKNPGKSVVFR